MKLIFYENILTILKSFYHLNISFGITLSFSSNKSFILNWKSDWYLIKIQFIKFYFFYKGINFTNYQAFLTTL